MSQQTIFKFRLYIAGETQNSVLAVSNLTALCSGYLSERYHVEVIDVFQDPSRALDDGVFLTPTLVRVAPAPDLKIVGTLSDQHYVLQALGLVARAA